jgi:tRNA-Thr(GGU) m(6)t(6)A37 methyltransferase TsaA
VPDTIALRPIGRVVRPDAGSHAVLEILPEYVDALDGVAEQEHLWILFWMHELSPEDRQRLRGHPMGDCSHPERGAFALHSPFRPNPIGMTRVRLISCQGTSLAVQGIDALDGSPVIDIKSG